MNFRCLTVKPDLNARQLLTNLMMTVADSDLVLIRPRSNWSSKRQRLPFALGSPPSVHEASRWPS
jgi:hypothetical protein